MQQPLFLDSARSLPAHPPTHPPHLPVELSLKLPGYFLKLQSWKLIRAFRVCPWSPSGLLHQRADKSQIKLCNIYRRMWQSKNIKVKEINFQILFVVLSVLAIYFIHTRIWTAAGKLSKGKSGSPRVEDSWEQRVVANDKSWEILGRKRIMNFTEKV